MENNDKIVCGICLEEGEAVELPVKLPDCGHAFCFLCCKSWLENIGSSERRCPICRTPCTQPTYSFKLMDEEDGREDERGNGERVGVPKWEYAGRTGGYWLYSPKCQLDLERAYQGWLEKEDEDSESESESESDKFEMTIGNWEYVIDFEEMIQYRKDQPGLKREIRRVVEDDGDENNVKGTAGMNDVFVG